MNCGLGFCAQGLVVEPESNRPRAIGSLACSSISNIASLQLYLRQLFDSTTVLVRFSIVSTSTVIVGVTSIFTFFKFTLFLARTMPLVDPVTMSSSAIVKGAVAQSASATKATPGSQGTDSTTPSTTGTSSSSLATLRPVLIKQTPAAQTVRHALPAALTALYLLRFDALVADPVPVMRNSLPVIAALQMTYALLCLPAAGEPASKSNRKPRPGEKKKGGDIGSSTIIVRYLLYIVCLLGLQDRTIGSARLLIFLKPTYRPRS